MNVTCRIELNYDSDKKAKQVLKSVQVDDASFMQSERKQSKIQTKITTNSVASMLHTIDDFLACVRVAENIIEKNE
jgi:tRNA threonylcarbamoyladenosine modification (KEOPS) complex  Pcc1 subunit